MPRLPLRFAVGLLAIAVAGCSSGGTAAPPAASPAPSVPAVAPTTEATTESTPTVAPTTEATTEAATPTPTATATATATAAEAAAGELTPPGTTLALGETATVPYEDSGTTSTLEVTVHAIEMGSPEDLADFELEPDEADDTPYYVPVTFTNVGDGDLSEAAVIGINARVPNATLTPLIFFGTFDRCPRNNAPAGFTNGVSFETCFTYLVDEGTVESVVWDYIAGEQAQYFQDPLVWPAA